MAPMRFTGTYSELQARLETLSGQGDWIDVVENQKQFRHHNGGILNWYPSTGTISFQGPSEARANFENAIRSILTLPSHGAAASLTKTPQTERPSVERVKDRPADSAGPRGPIGAEPVPATVKPVAPSPSAPQYLGQKYSESELVLGLVGAVGTELKKVTEILIDRLRPFGYEAIQVRISTDVIPEVVDMDSVTPISGSTEFARISRYMDAGNLARKISGDNSILALGVAARISALREQEPAGQPKPRPKHAYIVQSLKHPDEVARLREIYPEGFYLIGVHADEKRRHDHLTYDKRMIDEEADSLMRRDENETLKYGQKASDTFHLSDLFVRFDENQDKLKFSLWRLLDVIFGHPHATPTFDEYAMFMAFSAALRSADLSRQVGAVVARNKEIVATGANDCPRCGGGLYWPDYNENTHQIEDAPLGRDYTRGEDANKAELQRIIDDILGRVDSGAIDSNALRAALRESRLADITEYGRMVHAEMEALLSIARSNTSSVGATLYVTTFPCHNCAKHIVAAGIAKVIFIEPYPKSKAAELHSDSISLGFSDDTKTVHFEPFVGVGPRRFFDLFSMAHGSGYKLKRKDAEGQAVKWRPEGSKLRIQMLPCSYLELELIASSAFNQFRKKKEPSHGH